MPTASWSATSTAGRSRSRAIPLHPASLGGTSAIGQAEMLGFYDPDRSRGLIRDGEPQAWSSLLTALADAARRARPVARRGLPHPDRHHHVTHPGAPDRRPEAADIRRCGGIGGSRCRATRSAPAQSLAYGQPVELVPKLDAVDLLLAIDSDLFDSAPGHLRFARDFASRRNPDAHRPDEPRLCDRADADADRRGGGSSLHRRPARSGAHRAGAGGGAAAAGTPPPTCPTGSRRWSPT